MIRTGWHELKKDIMCWAGLWECGDKLELLQSCAGAHPGRFGKPQVAQCHFVAVL